MNNDDAWKIATLGQDVHDMTPEELREAEARARELIDDVD
jgi:hypothetical protein